MRSLTALAASKMCCERSQASYRASVMGSMFLYFSMYSSLVARSSILLAAMRNAAAASFMRDALAVRASSMSGVISSGMSASCTPSVFFFRDIESP